MFEKPEILSMAGALSAHAELRQRVIAENVANADTPGYRARDVADFSKVYRSDDGFRMKTVMPGQSDGVSSAFSDAVGIRPGSQDASPNGNSVSVETEMVAAADVKQTHDMALAIYRSSLGILRSSLGRH